jgi:hypothetical protein
MGRVRNVDEAYRLKLILGSVGFLLLKVDLVEVELALVAIFQNSWKYLQEAWSYAMPDHL